jgi:undecaprenyl diphosphate synthase
MGPLRFAGCFLFRAADPRVSLTEWKARRANGAPDPDLFIRTGGEVRISNFLLWQVAYTEFVFSDCLWPEFGEKELDAAIAEFHARDRRFGGVKDAS